MPVNLRSWAIGQFSGKIVIFNNQEKRVTRLK